MLRASMMGQSAIEYLMTYGWMLLVVAIVGGAIFSVASGEGIEGVSGFQGDDLRIDDFGMTESGLSMVVQAQGPDSVTVTGISLQENGEEVNIPIESEVSLSNEKVVNLPHFAESSETNSIDIEFTYDSGSLENITSSGTITGQIELDDRLIGYWILNELGMDESTLHDSSGNNNHAEISGELTPVQDDEMGEVLEFSGDDYLDTGLRPSEPDWTGTLCVSSYFYTDEESNENLAGIGHRDNNRFYIYNDAGRWQFGVGDDYSSGGSLNTEEWYYVCLSSTGDEGILYVNGDTRSTLSFEEVEGGEDRTIYLGHSNGESSELEGRISHAIFYNEPISLEEIQDLGNRPHVFY